MSVKNTEFKPIQQSVFVRSTGGGKEFVTYYEVIRIKTSHDTGVQYSEGKLRMLQSYEIQEIKEDKAQSFAFIKDHVDQDKNSKLQRSSIKYFLVVFANGRQVISQTYEEFINQIDDINLRV